MQDLWPHSVNTGLMQRKRKDNSLCDGVPVTCVLLPKSVCVVLIHSLPIQKCLPLTVFFSLHRSIQVIGFCFNLYSCKQWIRL